MQGAKTKPQEMEQVRELLRSLIAEGHSEDAIEMALSMLEQLRDQNNALMLRLLQFRREKSGRRGEKLDPAQLTLMLELCGEKIDDEDQDEADELADLDGEVIDETPARRGRPKRKRLSKDLPRDVHRHELDPNERLCGSCGDAMRHIGDDVSEILELVPAHFRVQEHRRAKYACSRCKETLVTAPGPVKLIEKGLPGPGLLAHIVESKYEDAMPLNRLRKIYARSGVELSKSSMCDWVGAVADLASPLADCIKEKEQASHVLQTDATGLKVLDHTDPEHVRLGTMWCSVGDRKYAVFRYAPTGTGEDGPWSYLAGRRGYVQADAANVFDRLYNGDCARATEVGCWAHARRGFFKLHESEARVAYPLQLIGKLYKVERVADRRRLSAEARVKFRRQRSTSILKRLKKWIEKIRKQEPPKSALCKACNYCWNHWEALTRFLEDGHLVSCS